MRPASRCRRTAARPRARWSRRAVRRRPRARARARTRRARPAPPAARDRGRERSTGRPVRSWIAAPTCALELLRGEREGLVAPPHAHREACAAAPLERDHADVGDRAPGRARSAGRPRRSRSRTPARAARRPRPRRARREPGSRARSRRPRRARRARAAPPSGCAAARRGTARWLRPFSDASPTFASTRTGAPAGASAARSSERCGRLVTIAFLAPCQSAAVRVDS